MTHCPICKKEIDNYFESSHREPFIHHSPFHGLIIYGPYSAEKEVICQNEDYLHFVFVDGEHRLVKLGVGEDKVSDSWDTNIEDHTGESFPF